MHFSSTLAVKIGQHGSSVPSPQEFEELPNDLLSIGSLSKGPASRHNSKKESNFVLKDYCIMSDVSQNWLFFWGGGVVYFHSWCTIQVGFVLREGDEIDIRN